MGKQKKLKGHLRSLNRKLETQGRHPVLLSLNHQLKKSVSADEADQIRAPKNLIRPFH